MIGPYASRHRVSIAALRDYPERIDVRSPSEFALDHVPSAVNHPVLDDAQREHIGAMYAGSPFAARKLGAALVARNIATMLETAFVERPREWRPLVYCWRGGQRSRSLTLVLNEVGWKAVQLEGGYRAYRRYVVAELASRPWRFAFVVVCGLTGSGKSRLIGALRAAGEQTLDLEGIARHRGSTLGDLPDDAQPSQKWFESQLADALSALDPARPVYVESESRRIGSVQMPDALLARMRDGRVVRIETPLARRVALLKEEYAHFLATPGLLAERLQRLTELHGKAVTARWGAMASAGDWDALIGELLAAHYDPIYSRSLDRNFPTARQALRVAAEDLSGPGMAALAGEVRAAIESGEAIAG
jgi:tRNA 2-selenouridine synthase